MSRATRLASLIAADDYQAERAEDRSTGGTGIGLSLTRELTTLMKGEIYLRSARGIGTVFFITIPLGKEHLAPSEYVVKEGDVIEVKASSKEIPKRLAFGLNTKTPGVPFLKNPWLFNSPVL